MTIATCHIKDLMIIYPDVFEDERGYFFESFNKQSFEEQTGIQVDFVQDNESKSTYGTLRGIHFQIPPFNQAKLVRAVTGKILDVAVDLRLKSPTFGQWHSEYISAENRKQLFVPRGFGHGFVVLSDSAVLSYKVDNSYSKECDSGILWNDNSLNIDWHIDHSEVLLSQKDKQQQSFQEFCDLNINWFDHS